MLEASDFLTMTRSQLAELLSHGHSIDPTELDDREYRGISLGLPELVEKLTWKKFKKVFRRDPKTKTLRGWNVRVEQNGLDQPWLYQRKNDEPVTFGHYQVMSDLSGYRFPRPFHEGLLIDYGRGKNSALDPTRYLRDPIVAVNRGSHELLLGWSYLDLGWLTVPTPSFFTLQRDIPLSHRATPPGERHWWQRTSG